MANLEQRIAALEDKLRQEKSKQQKIQARKRSEDSKIKRSLDLRQKILIGSLILYKVERKEISEDSIKGMLSKFLTRDEDRAIFNIPPLPTPQNNT
jgi:large subunit ribosomal protein L7/L12